MKFIAEEKDVVLKMWDKVQMPDSDIGKDEKGKTIFTKNGKMVEMTSYTFRDGFGDKLVFTTKNNDFRVLEGKQVNLILDVKLDDFTKKIKTALVGVTEAKK